MNEFIIMSGFFILIFFCALEYTLYLEMQKFVEIQKQRNYIFKIISQTLIDRLEYQKSKHIIEKVKKSEIVGHERN